MTSHVRHRRTVVAGALPAPNLEPGELALNLADGKLYSTDVASPAATSLLGVSIFKPTAQYNEGDMVNHSKMVWIAKTTIAPAAFDETQWLKLSSADVANEVNDAMAAHIAAPDPHPQYATDQDLALHVSAPDPHPQYTTDTEFNALKNATDPYPQYTTTAEAQGIANAAAAAVQLPFTPVQQGGGPNQTTNKVNIGWSASGGLLVSVDQNPFGGSWPINADAAKTVRSGASINGAAIVFTWTDPGGGGSYVWCGDGPGNIFVRPVASLRVANAANADAVNGISGWAYRNDANNPAYIWCTEGNGAAQHLTQPGSLSVNYANSSNYANRSGTTGTADNANALAGQGPSYWINNASTAVVNIRNNGAIQLIAGISGFGDVWWPVNISDERLKTDIAPCTEDSLRKVGRLVFKQYRFNEGIDDGHLHKIGIIAQEAELIDPEWISNTGSYKAPDTYALLLDALHAIQQLKNDFDAYRAAHP